MQNAKCKTDNINNEKDTNYRIIKKDKGYGEKRNCSTVRRTVAGYQ